MPTLINDIFNFIDLQTKKGRSKFFTPEQKTEALHFSQMQEFQKLYGLFEQEMLSGKKANNQDPFQLREIPEPLRPFIVSATLSTSIKKVLLPTDFAYPIAIHNGTVEIELIEKDKVSYRKKRELASLKIDVNNVSTDYQPFIKKTTIPVVSSKAALPSDFVYHLSIKAPDGREVEVLEHGQKESKRRARLIEQCRDYPNVREDIQPFLKRASETISSDKTIDLPDDYVHMVSLYFGDEELYVINNENKIMFKRERVVAMLKDLAREKDGYRPLLKTTTVNLTGGKASYPDDFIEHVYSYNNTEEYEPVDPKYRKYRLNSAILTKPFCIAYADYIEYLKSAVTQVNMDYIGLRFASIEGDKIRIENNITGDVDFIYISLYTANLGQDGILVHNSEVTSVDLSYVSLPVAHIINSHLEFETDLTDFNFSYLKVPTRPVWAYTTVNSRPVFDPNNSVDLEWNPVHHLSIIKGALTYLGVAVEDNDLVQYFDNKKTTGS